MSCVSDSICPVWMVLRNRCMPGILTRINGKHANGPKRTKGERSESLSTLSLGKTLLSGFGFGNFHRLLAMLQSTAAVLTRRNVRMEGMLTEPERQHHHHQPHHHPPQTPTVILGHIKCQMCHCLSIKTHRISILLT